MPTSSSTWPGNRAHGTAQNCTRPTHVAEDGSRIGDVKIYLEAATRRTVAAAIDWPGLARSGKSESEALAALINYGPRYRASMGSAAAGFEPPAGVDRLEIVERAKGKGTTDLGGPAAAMEFDEPNLPAEELERLVGLLRAAWSSFERSADAAEGRTLAPAGPRGGGRSLAKIRQHITDADAAYAGAMGAGNRPDAGWEAVRRQFVDAVRRREAGELPDRGPRGGHRWPARYAIRRSAWHALDHAWEIEDRLG